MLLRVGTLISSSRATGEGVAAWSPSALSPIAFWDFSDLSTMWQDTAGTTPVTTDGQTVARVDDKSGNGRHITQATALNCPTYRTSGGLHWLEFDGTNDGLMSGNVDLSASTELLVSAAYDSTASDIRRMIVNKGGNGFNAFNLARPFTAGTNHLQLRWDGDASGGGTGTVAVTAPASPAVAVGKLKASATASTIVRVNAVETTGTTTAGTGNFGTGPISVGQSTASTNPHLGKIYAVVIGPSSQIDAETQTSLEQWLAAKSGVTL